MSADPLVVDPVPVDPVLVALVRDRLARDGGAASPHAVAEALRRAGRPVGDATVLAVLEALRAESVGYGLLEPYFRWAGVTDVLVNGASSAWVDRGAGLECVDPGFAGEEEVRRLAQRLAAVGGRRLDDASPCVDVRLPDGVRFHAVLAPLAHPGTVLSFRVPHRRGLSLDDLVARETVTPGGARLLRALLAARLAFLVSGGTGSGKTTLLNALLAEVPSGERLVVVEDAAELRPPHAHLVGLESRPANVEGAGAVPLTVLVRQALRMRPDRLVVGEVRGAEVVDLLAALNTGHDGGAGTIHANSAADVPARVEALALAAGLGREAVHSQLSSGVQAVLHVARTPEGRRLVEVGMPVRGGDGLVRVEPVVRFGPGGTVTAGPAEAAFLARLR